jgi:DNA gyrase subunit A
MDSEKRENQGILEVYVEDEMKSSYIDYAMSVIIGRALPDVKDGFKPVHRRILYSMKELHLYPDKPHKKSARIVGEVLGKWHPHGDSAIYDAMVRMAQPFVMRYPLIDGHGNFGSVDGDNAAAMRYTEARLTPIAMEMLEDIDKNTVDWRPNFDESLQEPIVLPAKLPNLIINGSSGIAVGMATNIPPHNLTEVVDGLVAYIDNPDITVEELISYIPGPDFPTGAIINGRSGIISAYKTGRGIIKIRSQYEIVEHKNRERIIINEIPYQVNKSKLIESIADLVRNKKIRGISDIRDESDRDGMRIVIDLKRDAVAEAVANYLLKNTQMEVSFGINLLAIVDNSPVLLNLKTLLAQYVKHREDVIVRRTKYELELALKRAHILEGLIKALDNIDEVIALIKASRTPAEAKGKLMERFEFTEIQAQAILDMKLQKLTSLEIEALKKEWEELQKKIEYYRAILNSRQMVLDLIKDDLLYLKKKYGDERRTQIQDAQGEINIEDMIQNKEEVIIITHSDYVKRFPLSLYRLQNRGGKGVSSGKTKESDFVQMLFIANTLDYLLLFTDKGRVYWLKVYNIPEASKNSRGRPLINLVSKDKDENFTAVIPVSDFVEEKHLLMITKSGKIKKVPLQEFSRPRKSGIKAINFTNESDELVSVLKVENKEDIFVATKNGKSIRFSSDQVRSMGRTAMGVKAINLASDDEIISAEIIKQECLLDGTIFTITQNGYGKRTPIKEYRSQHRGGKGIKNIIVDHRNGPARVCSVVKEDDQLMVITRKGKLIRISVNQVRPMGRATKGVKIIQLDLGDEVMAIERILNESN